MAIVLRVYDAALGRDTLLCALESEGHVVVTAITGVEETTKFSAGRFDLVITGITIAGQKRDRDDSERASVGHSDPGEEQEHGSRHNCVGSTISRRDGGLAPSGRTATRLRTSIADLYRVNLGRRLGREACPILRGDRPKRAAGSTESSAGCRARVAERLAETRTRGNTERHRQRQSLRESALRRCAAPRESIIGAINRAIEQRAQAQPEALREWLGNYERNVQRATSQWRGTRSSDCQGAGIVVSFGAG